MSRIQRITAVLIAALLCISSIDAADCPGYTHKLIFAETPEIPHEWHMGIQNTDLLFNEIYFGVKDWFTLELMSFALPVKNVPEIEKDAFTTFTIKSPSLKLKLFKKDYRLGGGLKFFNTEFMALGEEDWTGKRDTIMDISDKSAVFFATQSLSWGNHYINLFSSVSFRDKGTETEDNTITTLFLMPGYKYKINARWDFVFEYLMSNMMFMPINPFFENWDQVWISYMFYGVRYTRKYFVLGLMAASHYTFSEPLPILPLISLGIKI